MSVAMVYSLNAKGFTVAREKAVLVPAQRVESSKHCARRRIPGQQRMCTHNFFCFDIAFKLSRMFSMTAWEFLLRKTYLPRRSRGVFTVFTWRLRQLLEFRWKSRTISNRHSPNTIYGSPSSWGFAAKSCRWTPEHGLSAVHALVKGATPTKFKTQLWQNVKFLMVVDDCEQVFETI